VAGVANANRFGRRRQLCLLVRASCAENLPTRTTVVLQYEQSIGCERNKNWFRVLTLRRARLNSFSHSPQWVTSSSGAHWASLETQTVASLLGKGKYNLSQIFDDKQFRNLNHFRLSASNLVSRNRTPTSSRAFS
jgi:hypothetical protein